MPCSLFAFKCRALRERRSLEEKCKSRPVVWGAESCRKSTLSWGNANMYKDKAVVGVSKSDARS